MALAITTKPAAPVLTVPEFCAHARLPDDTPDAVYIASILDAVTAWLAGPNGWLGRSLVAQTLTLTVPLNVVVGFVGPMIADAMTGVVLPRPPVIDVESVAVLDGAGAATTIPQTQYSTHEGPDGLTRLVLAPGFQMPTIDRAPAWLRIVYRAGYGAAGTDVDAGIRHAMLMAAMRLYAGRGDPTVTLGNDPMLAELFKPYAGWSGR
jgi:uncharacterized phiE125 gp8 family phage protein